jgi:hypothetical protein
MGASKNRIDSEKQKKKNRKGWQPTSVCAYAWACPYLCENHHLYARNDGDES